jgi:hypothetical protein
MKHLLLLSISICLIVNSGIAQSGAENSPLAVQQATTWGPSFPRIRDKVNFQLFSPNQDGYHLLLDASNTPSAILMFNQQHSLLKNQRFEEKYDYSPLTFRGVVASSSDTLACFSHFSTQSSRQSVSIAPFRNGILGSLKPLLSYEIPTTYQENAVSIDKYNNLGVVSPLYSSPNGNKLAYVQCLSLKTVNSQADFVLAVMNESGELIWQREIKRKEVAEYITILDVAVSDAGEVFLLAQLHTSKAFATAVGAPHIEGYRCQVFRISENSIQDFDIYLKEDLVPIESKLYFSKSDNDVLTVSGLYNDLASSVGRDGVFINQLDLNQETFTTHTYSFLDFMDEENSSNEYDNNWQDHLVLRDFFSLNNGHFGFVAEVSYARSSRVNSNSQIVNYFTNQLVIPWFDEHGKLLRIATLAKNLSVDDPKVSSYAVGMDGDQLHFLYNTFGNEELLQLSSTNKKNSIFTLLRTLNAQGQWSGEKIAAINTESGKNIFARRTVFTNSTCFFAAANRKFFQIGNISLDK